MYLFWVQNHADPCRPWMTTFMLPPLILREPIPASCMPIPFPFALFSCLESFP
jgi:hypothetical protein